jgi:hypothetical protein
MHWGDTLEKGSEQLVNNNAFPAEVEFFLIIISLSTNISIKIFIFQLHFVFWNSDLYPDPKKASESSKNDGLLVVGAFMQVKI